MRRLYLSAVVACCALAAPSQAQPRIQQATLKKIDLANKTVTLTQDGRDQEYGLSDTLRVEGVSGADAQERLKGLKPGTRVQFLAATRDGKPVLMGLRPADAAAASRPQLKQVDVSKLLPLIELGTGRYQGFQGGLYPDGKNVRPPAHEKAGLALAQQVQPLDADGKPNTRGKIVLLSIGMSNTSQSSQGLQRALAKAEGINPHVVFVNGAQGGMTAFRIQKPDDNASGSKYWSEVDNRLKKAGVTRAQVQAVWIKQADAGPNEGFPDYAKKLEGELTRIVQLLPGRFPNLKLAYLSSRTYGGYATTPLNPEPYAYESGFSVKWLIERQIQGDPALNFNAAKGPIQAPWLSWGPYLWAQGSTPRSDGFRYEKGDFTEQDGTHQSPAGMAKVGAQLLLFFQSDSTTRPWFTAAHR